MEKKKGSLNILLGCSIALIVALIYSNSTGAEFWSVFGVGIVVNLLFRFINKIGKSFPVLELMLLLAGIQWIIGPLIDYYDSVNHFKYYMRIDEQLYMSIAVPIYSVFVITTLLNVKDITIKTTIIKNWADKNFKLIIGLIILGGLSSFGSGFVFYLLSNFKFIGVMALLFSNHRLKYVIFSIVYFGLFIQAFQNAMFHNLLLWSVFIFFVFANLYKIKFINKVLIILIGFGSIFILQSIKKNYRMAVWSKDDVDRVDLFMNVVSESLDNEEYNSEETQSTVNARFNQGWIISIIIDRYHDKEKHGGETVIEAIKAALFPRFILKNKVGGGGRFAFEKLTGMNLSSGTAMGVSLLGEFYGSFGFYGAMIAFFIWGTFLRFVVNFFSSNSVDYPILVLFIPLIFFQVVKAESDLVTVLNHIVKSCILVYITFRIIKKQLLVETVQG